jgi:hypothetical protein
MSKIAVMPMYMQVWWMQPWPFLHCESALQNWADAIVVVSGYGWHCPPFGTD